MSYEYILMNIALWFGLYLIVALSLNVEYGYAGIPNFGRALAVLVGAFAVGGIVNRVLIMLLNVNGDIVKASGEVKSLANTMIAHNPAYGITLLIISIIIAAIIGAIIGALFILPSAKLSEDYLAITLLAISEVAFMVCNYETKLVGGYYGVSVPDILAFVPGEKRMLAFVIIIFATAFLVFLVLNKMLATPFGRLLKAMRENEELVKAYGKDVMRTRIKVVALGSAIAAIAGVLFSFYSVNVIARSFNRVEWTFYPFLMVLLGGIGNNIGVTLGVLSFVVVKVLLITYKYEIKSLLHLPFESTWLEYILFGIIMILILLYKPEGLIKEKPIFTKPITEKIGKLDKEKNQKE